MEMEKEIKILNIDDVLPNRFQPRITFKDEKINELADSIKEHGVIQPITVRKVSDKYEIITGERRYKASIIAGKKTIPAIVTNLNDEESAEIALIENVQRQDLTPIEEAISYKKILDMGYLNQSALAEKLGKTQSTIANKLRLLNLTDEVQDALLQEKISERHARSLLKLHAKEQKEMLNRIIKERLTVRKTDEEIVKILTASENKIDMSQIKSEPSEIEIKPVKIENTNLEVHPEFNLNPVNNFNTVQSVEENNDIEILDFLSDSNQEKGEINNMNNNFNSFNIPNDPIIEPKEEPITFGNPVINNNQEQSFQFEEPKEIVQTFDSFNSIVENNQESPAIFVNNDQNINNSEASIISDMAEIPNIEKKEEGPKFFTMFKPEIENNYVEDMEQDSANMSFNKEEQQPKSVFDFTPINLEPEKEEPKNELNMYSNTSLDKNLTNNQEPVFQNQPVPNNNNIFNQTTNVVENNSKSFENKKEDQQEDLSFMSQMNPYTLNDDAQFTPMSNVEMQSPNPFENQYQYKTEVELQPLMQIEEEKPVMVDFKTVINTIRECSNTIEKYGYTIDTEELDFEDSYQVIFKINKQ